MSKPVTQGQMVWSDQFFLAMGVIEHATLGMPAASSVAAGVG